MKLQLSDKLHLTDRFVHLGDCAVFNEPVTQPNPMDGIETQRDELIAYALKLRPCYDRINRIIGQLAGLFILMLARERFIADYPAITLVQDQMAETIDAVHAIKPPIHAQRHYVSVVNAMELVNSVTAEFDASVRSPRHLQETVDSWTGRLKAAHAILVAAASQELGCMPVDFSQACCSCGVGAA